MEGCCGGLPSRHSGSLAGSPSARHSSTWHQHEGKVRTCSQQVLQALLAIGTVTPGKTPSLCNIPTLERANLAETGTNTQLVFLLVGGAIHFYLPPEVTASRTSDLSSPHRFSAIDPSVSGGVGEWLKPPDLKSGKGASPSGVRIPPPPPSTRPESSSIIHKTACQTLQMLGSFKNNLQSCPKHSACIRDYLTG